MFSKSRCSKQQDSDDDAECNLIVNFIPLSYRERHLKKLFSKFGEIKSCRVMRFVQDGETLSKGYGFVKFRKKEHAEAAIRDLNGKNILGKVIKISLAHSNWQRNKINLYVSQIPIHWGKCDLESYFAPHGTVVECRVLMNRNGQSRRCGFVRYEKDCQARKAIANLNNKSPSPSDEPIQVRRAAEDENNNYKKYTPRKHAQKQHLATNVENPMMSKDAALLKEYAEMCKVMYKGNNNDAQRETKHKPREFFSIPPPWEVSPMYIPGKNTREPEHYPSELCARQNYYASPDMNARQSYNAMYKHDPAAPRRYRYQRQDLNSQRWDAGDQPARLTTPPRGTRSEVVTGNESYHPLSRRNVGVPPDNFGRPSRPLHPHRVSSRQKPPQDLNDRSFSQDTNRFYSSFPPSQLHFLDLLRDSADEDLFQALFSESNI